MSPGPAPFPFILRVALALVPREFRLEVKEDLARGHRDRVRRKGEKRARRYLYREAVGLLLWRCRWWRGLALTRESTEKTALKTSATGQDLLQDLRFGLRTLLRRPAFSLTVLGVLGMGIGGPAVVLTLVDTIFLRPPEHIREPERILRLTRGFGEGRGGGALGNPDYLYYRKNASTLQELAAYGGGRAAAYTADGINHHQLRLLFVSENFFDLLGVRPARGRTFLPEENATPGTHPVVVLSHDFWVRALGGDPEVLGRSIRIGGDPYTILGIGPPGFGSVSPVGTDPDAWVPIAMYGALTRAPAMDWWERVPNMKSRWLVALGRLAPGVTYEAARENLLALGESLSYDGKSEGETAFVQRQFLYSPYLEETLGTLSRMLVAAVAMVLLVAALNAALLLLSRATNRYREMGIRGALGAGRGRIVRQVLAETLLLGLGGGFLGLGLAFGLSEVAAGLLPVRFHTPFRPQGGVILATTALALLTALGAGVLPALHATRGSLRDAFQGDGRGGGRSWVRSSLVVGQVALSLVLVAGALLFGRSFMTARGQDLGFATEDRLVVRVNLRELDYVGGEGITFLNQALARLGELPGVLEVSATRQIPFQGDWSTNFHAPPGARPNDEDDQVYTGMNAVSPGYFQVAGVPILRGRALDARDVAGAPPAVVINQVLAEDLWPGQDPVGRFLPMREDSSFEVVGVARTATYYGLGEDPQPQAYVALNQFLQFSVNFLVHTAGPAAPMAPVVQDALRELDPRLVFNWVTTMAAVFEEETDGYEVSAVLVSIFSLVALLLAGAGLYGTLSFLVARRTREIGVRMALGAPGSKVARQVLRFGMGLVFGGLLLGLAGALVLRRFTSSLLYGVAPGDPISLVGACLVLLMVAGLALIPPTRRAVRVDPMTAIRIE